MQKQEAAAAVRPLPEDVSEAPHQRPGEADDDGPSPEKLGSISHEMAVEATLAEHDMTMWQAIVKYRKAAMWSVFVSMCIIMRAYDIAITGGFYALPSFQRSMGEPFGSGYQVPVQWQVAMSLGATVGQVAGSWLVGIPMERLGRKKTLALYLLLSTCVVFMQFFAPNRHVLTAAYYLAGIIWGGYQVLAPTYAAEVLPMRLRSVFTTYVALCYNIGSLLQTGISRGLLSWTAGGDWQWRVGYAIQWFWPAFILAFLYWAPESPWWLIRQNRFEDAKKSLDRLSAPSEHGAHNRNVLAMMVRTDAYEHECQVGATYRDCVRDRSNRRRLEIAAAVFIVQDFSGNPSSFAVYLFEQIGLSSDNAFNMGVGLSAMGFFGVLLAPPVILFLGRRRTWLWGLWYNLACMWIVGFLTLARDYKTNDAYPWVQATMLITMQLTSHVSISPLSYVISSEVPSTKLRAKTLGIAASVNGVCALIINVVGPYLLNPGAAGAGCKIQFLWGGLTIFCLLWSYYRLPETSNRTYEELDIMFTRNVPARDFKTYDTGIHRAENEMEMPVGQGTH